jgi:hypothetical protein
MRVPCESRRVTLTNDRFTQVSSVRVVCSECQHYTESYGTGENSIRRCLALLREECPNGEENFYFLDEI